MDDRTFGLTPGADLKAADQLLGAASYPKAKLQPLPPGKPGRVEGAAVGIKDTDSICLLVTGDTGGIKAVRPQNSVSVGMQQSKRNPAFFYHLGDIDYFNGDQSEYLAQFYEAYAHLAISIVAIPGNHDGDPDPTVSDQSLTGMPTFMANFCSSSPEIPVVDPQLEYGRHTQTQPYCDWTLNLKALTIVGAWTNAPSGGHLEQSQLDFLVSELKAAPTDRPLVLAGHHPQFSVDSHHGGSKKMLDFYTGVFDKAGRVPDLIFGAHVHNYQRFSWTYAGKTIPVIVCGNGGYHNKHQLAADATPGMDLGNGVVFEYGDDKEYGFIELEAAGGKLTGHYSGVTPGNQDDGSDAAVTWDKDAF